MEVSFVYILSDQRFAKTTPKSLIWRVFENLKLAVKQCYRAGQKIGGKYQF